MDARNLYNDFAACLEFAFDKLEQLMELVGETDPTNAIFSKHELQLQILHRHNPSNGECRDAILCGIS